MALGPLIIEFEVEEDESGGYNASAQVGTHSLITEGDTLDELHDMVEDLLRLFEEESGEKVLTYSLVFSPIRVAA